jgi:predicted RNA-binding Zn-ribbon protein involved in translation (DUF1610 family)
MSIWLAFGLACAFSSAFAGWELRHRKCPGCGTRLLRRVASREPGGVRTYRCSACTGEFLRHRDGPLVPRHLWNQGMREGIPPARLLDR